MSTVRIERDGSVLVVTIDRPEVRNAVDVPTAEALLHALEAYDRDDTLSVAVLTGAGGTFCAGADLKAFGTPSPPQQGTNEANPSVLRSSNRLWTTGIVFARIRLIGGSDGADVP